MDNNDSLTVTPEKIKDLLLSFLVKPNKMKESGKNPAESRNTESDSDSLGTTKSCISNTLRSHASFIERLESFSIWFGKPLDLSPLVCARYGWENVDTDMLRCVGCKTFLSGQLPNKSDYLAFQESYNRLKKSLISAHDKFCIVAANPCPEHFCHVPVEDPTLLMVGFTERVKALMVVQDKLPCIALSKLQSLGYDEGQAGAYCKRNLLPDYDSTAQVVTLAFAGWTCCLSKKDVLQCCMCLRQIGIWNYLPMSHCSYSSEHVTEHEDQEGEPTVKKRKIAKAFDPIEEHNHWCPWIQPSSLPVLAMATNESGQTNPHSYLAWIAAIKVIAPGLMDKNAGLACSMKTSPMVEGLRCFRKVIKSWSSKKSGHQPFLQSTEQL